jgi:hypothetical protein
MPQNTAKKNIAKNGETLEATGIPNDFKGFGKEQKYPLCASHHLHHITKREPEGRGFVRKSSPFGFCNQPE